MSEEVTVSKSKQKREAREAEVKAIKKKHNIESIISWTLGIIIAAVAITLIVLGIKDAAMKVESSSDFSAGLTEEGFIEGADISKVDVDALEAIVIPYAEVEYTQEKIDEQVKSLCESYATYSTDSSLTVKDGDAINLDYIGYIDGEAFEGGNTNGEGYQLTIGSQSFIDNFEEQLIGTHPGDSKDVIVTFPEEYSNNPDLAGKEATFKCVINSIKVDAEYNDEFITTNFSEYASTTAEFEEYLAKIGYENNVANYIGNYIANNSKVKGAPKSYINHIKSVKKYNDESTYAYRNQYFMSMTGYALYESFDDYTQMSEKDYLKSLAEYAEATAASDLTCEAYFRTKGLTISDEMIASVISSYGSDAGETFGMPFLRQEALKRTVVEHLVGIVKVEGK